jgi:Arc/MetJ-type ribon-helix-helix transcriptional regulator
MNNRPDVASILKTVQEKLRAKGIHIDMTADLETSGEADGTPRVKIVCVAPGLRDSVREMEKNPRDQVVMVRVDEKTSQALDAWVETGAVKSRSEAAALFIREGLKMRADELDRLRDALKDVESAKERLRQRVTDLFGDEAKAE